MLILRLVKNYFMKNLVILLLLLPFCAAGQTVTILPTSAMIKSDGTFTSLGESSYMILSPNQYSEEEMAIIRFRQAPGNTIDFHLHYDTDEFFYVLEGSMKMQVRDSTFTAGPNTLVHVPAGTPHSHGNESGTMLDVLLMYQPGKMAELFRAWGNLVESGVSDPDQLRQRLLELPQDFDVEFIEE